MKKNIYVSPILVEEIVVTEKGFAVSDPVNGNFNDYTEEDYKW
jgi:hypothetical protein